VMSELLGIDTEQIRFWLCNRKIVTANETVTKPLTSSQVCDVTSCLYFCCVRHSSDRNYTQLLDGKEMMQVLLFTIKENLVFFK